MDMMDRKEVLTDFMQKLCDSGYSHPTRMEIVKSATRKYYCQVMDQEASNARLYRSSAEMAGSGRIKALINNTLFKSKRGGQRVTPRKNLPGKRDISKEANTR